MIGQTITHYRILEKLGEGGMGVVYKAQDTKLERLVALKFLPEHVSASSADLERFTQEAKAAAGLNHPNICTIHGIEEADGKNFIVMEFVDGQTLQEMKSLLSVKQALDIGIQIAEGLAAAHDKGIVHRDIKPENIMIRRDGRVQIMDFGLAKLRGASRLTKEGSTVGTLGYMSPEQVQGLDPDHRSDIFSLGVILYELFAGQSPFKGVHETAIIYEIVNVEPPLMSSIKSEIDPELDRLVLTCLEKDPSDRIQSAAEVARNLRLMRNPSGSGRKTSSRVFTGGKDLRSDSGGAASKMTAGRLWLLLSASLVCGTLLGLGLAELFGRDEGIKGGATGIPIRSSINLPEEVPLILGFDQPTIGYNSPVVSLAPDGAFLGYVARTSSGSIVYLVNLSTGEATPLAGSEGASYAFFSPDGEWVGFLTHDRVKKIPRQGGAAITLSEATSPILAWWMPSGTIYFTEDETRMLSKVLDDGTQRSEVLGSGDWRFEGSILPGEKFILATRNSGISRDYGEIILIEITTGTSRTLFSSGYAPMYVTPGYLLFSRAGSLLATRFDSQTGEVQGEPVTVVRGVAMESLFGVVHASASSNGIVVFVPGSDLSVGRPAWIDRRGVVEFLDLPERVYGVLDLSPDDRHLALHVGDVKDHVLIWDFERKEARRLTSRIAEGWPNWSHDGRRLLTQVARAESTGAIIRDMTSEGSVASEILLDVQADAWSADDRVVMLRDDSGNEIGFVGLEDSLDAITMHGAFPTSSPNGRYLAYMNDQSSSLEVYIRRFPVGNILGQVSTGGGTEPLWMASGELFFREGRRWYVTRMKHGTRTSWDTPRLVFDTDFIDTPGWSYDVSKDSRRLIVIKRTTPVVSSRIDLVANWTSVLND